MSSAQNPSIEVLFGKYRAACLAGDEVFLRAMLPANVPDDEFAFVVESSRDIMQALDASGVEPEFVQAGNRCDAVFQGDLGDGVTEFKIDFYLVEGSWLKYEPDAP